MILAIVGPTGVGKTKLSIELAKIYNGEIINCDSLQIYEGLDIGTAKITKEEMEHIPHHLLSIKKVTDDYSVYDYQRDARDCIKDIQRRKKIPILVGGTGLYLKAVLYDYEFLGESNLNDSSYDNFSNQELAKRIDAFESEIIYDHQNRQRMERLLKRLENGYVPKKEDFKLLYDDVLVIGLTTDREILYQKINQRFDTMLIPLVDEVKSFYLQGIYTKPLKNGIGYKELYEFFENKKTLQEVVKECKQNSRNYAKRQYTWFENQMDVVWFSVNYENFSKTISEVTAFIEENLINGDS